MTILSVVVIVTSFLLSPQHLANRPLSGQLFTILAMFLLVPATKKMPLSAPSYILFLLREPVKRQKCYTLYIVKWGTCQGHDRVKVWSWHREVLITQWLPGRVCKQSVTNYKSLCKFSQKILFTYYQVQ